MLNVFSISSIPFGVNTCAWFHARIFCLSYRVLSFLSKIRVALRMSTAVFWRVSSFALFIASTPEDAFFTTHANRIALSTPWGWELHFFCNVKEVVVVCGVHLFLVFFSCGWKWCDWLATHEEIVHPHSGQWSLTISTTAFFHNVLLAMEATKEPSRQRDNFFHRR